MTSSPSIALVHDWLLMYGGAEKVLENLLEIFPGSPVYTLLYRPQAYQHSTIAQADVRPSGLDRWPGIHKTHQLYLPAFPIAVEQLDLRGFDIVLSLSHTVAHGVLLNPNQLHINYILSPARFAWHQYQDYLEESPWARGLRSMLVKPVLHYFRLWDAAAADRVDRIAAISHWIEGAVRKAYRRDADVIYPPVDVERFTLSHDRGDTYITAARLVSNKRIDLIVRACTALGRKLVVVGEGPEKRRLARMAGKGVEFLGWQEDARLDALLGGARAFIHAAEDDFGIAPLEALATGCPVIALGRGAALETMRAGETGQFFAEPTVEALMDAIRRFEEDGQVFAPDTLRAHVLPFRKERFQQEFQSYVASAWAGFRASRPGAGVSSRQ